MPGNINESIEHADSCYCCKQEEQEMLFNDFYFSRKIFPRKGCNDDCGAQPAIKGKCNRGDVFYNASCDDKISRPDKCGKNCEGDANKQRSVMMADVHFSDSVFLWRIATEAQKH